MKKVGVKVSAAVVAVIVAFFSLVYPIQKVSANVNKALLYYIYDANGNFKSSYFLRKVETLTASNERSVIGNDSRMGSFNKGICKITFTDKATNESSYGTGFVVDEHTIATAAHCLYSKSASDSRKSSSIVLDKIVFVDNRNHVELQITSSDIKAAHIPFIYTTGSGADYALITVNTDLSDRAVFNLGYPMDSMSTSDISVTCTGFPGEKNDINSHYMMAGRGNVEMMSDELLYHSVDTSSGQSGSPLYVTTSYGGNTYYTVIGMQVMKPIDDGSAPFLNRATRMTTNVLHFYKNNPNL